MFGIRVERDIWDAEERSFSLALLESVMIPFGLLDDIRRKDNSVERTMLLGSEALCRGRIMHVYACAWALRDRACYQAAFSIIACTQLAGSLVVEQYNVGLRVQQAGDRMSPEVPGTEKPYRF